MQSAESAIVRTVRDLRRRKVFRTATAYAVAAWLVVEVADVIFPLLGMPDVSLRVVALIAVAGLPVVILLSWVFDLTPEGIVRTTQETLSHPTTIDRRVDYVIIAVLIAIVGFLLVRPDTAGQVRSIAVLPFEDFSETGNSEYLADGIAEELLNSLVGIEGLRVAARTSSFAFKGQQQDIRSIGESLNVDTILEGSVQREGGRVRVTAQLINVADGFHIWTQTFDRQVNNIFAIRDEISSAIVDALKVRLGASETARMASQPTPNFEAFDLYLLGRYHWHQRTPKSLQRAADLFHQAAAADPQFALAYSGLADTYLLLHDYGDLPADQAQQQAEAAIARALQLDPMIAEPYASLGLLRMMREDFNGAELAFRNALEIDSSYSMAHMWLGLTLDRLQGPAAALPQYAQAQQTDRLHPVISGNLAGALGRMGRFDEAQTNLLEVLQKNPGEDALRRNLAWLNASYGRFDKAIEWALPVVDTENNPDKIRAVIARNFAVLGDFESARRFLEHSNPETEPEGVFSARASLLMASGEYARLIELADARRDSQTAEGDKSKSLANMWRGYAMVMQGNFNGAVAALENFSSSSFGKMIAVPDQLRILGLVAYSYNQLGNQAEAMRALKVAEEMASGAQVQGWANPDFKVALAGNSALNGNSVEAISMLDQAFNAGWRDLWATEFDPRFLSLHDDQKYQSIVRQMRSDVESMRERAVAIARTSATAALVQ